MVEVGLRVELTRGESGELVWRHDLLRESELYPASSDAGVELNNKTQALRRISSVVAARIHDELQQTR